MAKTVDQIREQIARLQAQEKALLQKEAQGVIARIKEAVEHYGITPEQIFGTGTAPKSSVRGRAVGPHKAAAEADKKAGRAKPAKAVKITKSGKAAGAANKVVQTNEAATTPNKVSPSKGTTVAPKYKDETGNIWSGRGSQPRWLRAAIEGGKKLEDFALA